MEQFTVVLRSIKHGDLVLLRTLVKQDIYGAPQWSPSCLPMKREEEIAKSLSRVVVFKVN